MLLLYLACALFGLLFLALKVYVIFAPVREVLIAGGLLLVIWALLHYSCKPIQIRCSSTGCGHPEGKKRGADFELSKVKILPAGWSLNSEGLNYVISLRFSDQNYFLLWRDGGRRPMSMSSCQEHRTSCFAKPWKRF